MLRLAVIPLLLLLLLGLQIRLWFGDGSIAEVWRLERQISAQREENRRLRRRNDELDAEVRNLKDGLEALEERARYDLGMIRGDEVFYMVVEE